MIQGLGDLEFRWFKICPTIWSIIDFDRYLTVSIELIHFEFRQHPDFNFLELLTEFDPPKCAFRRTINTPSMNFKYKTLPLKFKL